MVKNSTLIVLCTLFLIVGMAIPLIKINSYRIMLSEKQNKLLICLSVILKALELIAIPILINIVTGESSHQNPDLIWFMLLVIVYIIVYFFIEKLKSSNNIILLTKEEIEQFPNKYPVVVNSLNNKHPLVVKILIYIFILLAAVGLFTLINKIRK